MTDHNDRDYFQRRVSAMRNERQSFIPHWKELADFIQPRRGRFFTTDRNKGNKRYGNIINSHATQSHRISRSGLFAGTSSPTRPWFAFITADPELMEFQPVKIWLEGREKLIRAILNSSNFYNMTPILLGELLLFGTGCMTHVDDFNDVARFYTHTVGSYMIGQDERFVVNTLVREFQRTTEQLVKQFGVENVSQTVKDAWDRGNYDRWFDIVHFIEPNPGEDETQLHSKFKAFRSVYYEPGNVNKQQFLGVSGFDEFPAYCPRWDITNEDIYGTDCPGMTSLGDVKQLQVMEKRKAQGIDKMVNPPLHGPSTLRNVPISSLPGGTNLYDAPSAGNTLQPIYEVNPRLGELVQDLDKVERRIGQAYFTDLFNAITNMEGIQPRNEEEILRRNEERLLQLGPPLERIHGEFSSKVINRLFNQTIRADLVPPAPPELQGQELDIKFISSLAMAQRAVAVGGIERLAGYVSNIAQVNPDVVDKFDWDQSVDEFANAIGVPPKIVVSDDNVEAIRIQKAQQQRLQQAVEAAQAAGPTVAQIATADLEPDSMLSRAANLQSEDIPGQRQEAQNVAEQTRR